MACAARRGWCGTCGRPPPTTTENLVHWTERVMPEGQAPPPGTRVLGREAPEDVASVAPWGQPHSTVHTRMLVSLRPVMSPSVYGVVGTHRDFQASQDRCVGCSRGSRTATGAGPAHCAHWRAVPRWTRSKSSHFGCRTLRPDLLGTAAPDIRPRQTTRNNFVLGSVSVTCSTIVPVTRVATTYRNPT